jgi:hypothetical protein
MRALRLFAMIIVATQFPPAIAQISSQGPVEQIIAQTHAAFGSATSAREIEAVELWCRDSLVLLSFREREGLMTSAISLLHNNDFEQANAAFERLRRYDQLSKNTDDHDCKPDLQDEGLRQRLQASAIVTLPKSEALRVAKAAKAQDATPKDRPEATDKAEPPSPIAAADARSATAAQSAPLPESAKPVTPSSEPRVPTENAGRASMVAHADQPSTTLASPQPEAPLPQETASSGEKARQQEAVARTEKPEPSSSVPAAETPSVLAAQSEPPPTAARPTTPATEREKEGEAPPSLGAMENGRPPVVKDTLSSQPEAASPAKPATSQEEAMPQEAVARTEKPEPLSSVPAVETLSVLAMQSEAPAMAAGPATAATERERGGEATRSPRAAEYERPPVVRDTVSSQPEAAFPTTTATSGEETGLREPPEAREKAGPSSSAPAAAALLVATAQSAPPREAAKPTTLSSEPLGAAENSSRATTEQSSTTPASLQPEVTLSGRTEAAGTREPAEPTASAEPLFSGPAAEDPSVAAAQSAPSPEGAKPTARWTESPQATENAGRAPTLAEAAELSTTPTSQQPDVTLSARSASSEEAARTQEPAEATKSAETSSSVSSAEEAARRLSAQGLVALAQGDIVGSRAYLQRAAEAGDVRALLALGETYDPATLGRIGARGIKGDAAAAREYYAKALAAGVVAVAQSEEPPEAPKPAPPWTESPEAAENVGRAPTLADVEQSSTTPASQESEVTLSTRTAPTEEAARAQEPAESMEKAETSPSVNAAEDLSVARPLPPRFEAAQPAKIAGIEARGSAPSSIETTEDSRRTPSISSAGEYSIALAEPDTRHEKLLDRPSWILLSAPLLSAAPGRVERDPWRGGAWSPNKTIGSAPGRSLWAEAEVASVSGTGNVKHHRPARYASRHQKVVYRHTAMFGQFNRARVSTHHTEPGYLGYPVFVPF